MTSASLPPNEGGSSPTIVAHSMNNDNGHRSSQTNNNNVVIMNIDNNNNNNINNNNNNAVIIHQSPTKTNSSIHTTPPPSTPFSLSTATIHHYSPSLTSMNHSVLPPSAAIISSSEDDYDDKELEVLKSSWWSSLFGCTRALIPLMSCRTSLFCFLLFFPFAIFTDIFAFIIGCFTLLFYFLFAIITAPCGKFSIYCSAGISASKLCNSEQHPYCTNLWRRRVTLRMIKEKTLRQFYKLQMRQSIHANACSPNTSNNNGLPPNSIISQSKV